MELNREGRAAFRRECNRRRANNWTIRGYTRQYAVELKGMECVFDREDAVWLAPNEETITEVGQWPGVVVGTPGPRIQSGYYRGFAALAVPKSAAVELVEHADRDQEPLLYAALQLRANYGSGA